jgi:hypothetical protein
MADEFEKSDKQEIENLIDKDVFSFELIDQYESICIFKFRLIREIKSKVTNVSYEIFWLVVQEYNNEDKAMIFTQSSIIQRVSQRLIVALISALALEMSLWLRDISQAYTQFIIKVNQTILTYLSKENETFVSRKHHYENDQIFV